MSYNPQVYIGGCAPCATGFQCDPCAEPEAGRIRAVGFLRESRYNDPGFDPSNADDWLQALVNGDAFIIPGVRGSYDGGSEVTAEGYGSQQTRVVGSTRTSTINFPFNCANQDRLDCLRQASNFVLFMRTQNTLMSSRTAVKTMPMDPVEETTESTREHSLQISWSSINLPKCYDIPGAIFDDCEALGEAIEAYVASLGEGLDG